MARPRTKPDVHLSHSQVDEFTQCPRKYHIHRVLLLPPQFTPSGLLFGVSLHEALALYQQRRLEGGKASLDELHAAFQTSWGSELLPVRYSRGESADSLKALARSMLAFFLAHPYHAGDVLAVEEPFQIELSPALPPIEGWIDLVERAPDGGLVVTDFKTARAFKEPEPDQLVLYTEAARTLDCPEADCISARFVVLLKTQEPEIAVYTPELSAGHLQKLIKSYQEVWQAIQSGCSFAKRDWWCGGCQWKGHCEES